MNFLLLTVHYSEKSIRINFSLVESYRQYEDDGNIVTWIELSSGGSVYVKETPEEIDKMILSF